MSKYVNVDAFVEALCKTLSTLRKQKDNTPESIAFLKGAQVVAKELMKFPAADVAPAVELEDLRAKYQALVAEKAKNSGDTAETYTTGYRYGHRNGQIELLQQILDICDGVSEPEETNE